MKHALILIGLLSVCSACSPTQKAIEQGNGTTAIDGAWEVVESVVDGQLFRPYRPQQLKIFHDGFFSFTHYNSDGSFNGSGSGTYTLNGNQYQEIFRYYSDTIWVGFADLQTWELRGDTLIFAGFKKVLDRSGREMPAATWGGDKFVEKRVRAKR